MSGGAGEDGAAGRGGGAGRVLQVVYGSWLNLIGLGLLVVPDAWSGPPVAAVGGVGLRAADAAGIGAIVAWTAWLLWALVQDLEERA